MTYRILHLADLHLDTSFAGAGFPAELSRRRRAGLRESLRKAVEVAMEEEVDAVTIAGDLYERERSTPDTMEFLKSELGRLQPVPVLIAPGNHDPMLPGSFYALDDWPPNVHIFREPRLVPHQLPEGPVVWGAGHDSPAYCGDLASTLPGGQHRGSVLLLHGTDRSCVIGENKAAHCPFSRQEVAGSGVGLALLGHLHTFQHSRVEDTVFCYPGSVEPLAFGDTGDHGAVLAEFRDGSWDLSRIALSKWQYCRAELDISSCRSQSDIADAISSLWPANASRDQLIAQVRLTGSVSDTVELDLPAIITLSQHRFAHLRVENRANPPYDFDAISQEPTTKGRFVRKMLELLEPASPDERSKLGKTLVYGLLALEGREVHLG